MTLPSPLLVLLFRTTLIRSSLFRRIAALFQKLHRRERRTGRGAFSPAWKRSQEPFKLTPRSPTPPASGSISDPLSSDEASSSMRRNKELYSSFRDTYFLHYCGSCKVESRFLRGPLYERAFTNVLLVNWKAFPLRAPPPRLS